MFEKGDLVFMLLLLFYLQLVYTCALLRFKLYTVAAEVLEVGSNIQHEKNIPHYCGTKWLMITIVSMITAWWCLIFEGVMLSQGCVFDHFGLPWDWEFEHVLVKNHSCQEAYL